MSAVLVAERVREAIIGTTAFASAVAGSPVGSSYQEAASPRSFYRLRKGARHSQPLQSVARQGCVWRLLPLPGKICEYLIWLQVTLGYPFLDSAEWLLFSARLPLCHTSRRDERVFSRACCEALQREILLTKRQ